jgi:pimeloyl-ACP methyl ester carboxylesterase
MECKLSKLTMFYKSIGKGRPILMLHGWPLDHRAMVGAMEPIFKRRPGWRRIYPDLPGMGKTTGEGWIETQDHMLDVVCEFVDHVIGEEQFAIAGLSYGGYLARGIIHSRAKSVIGLALIVPAMNTVGESRDVPSHITLVEDASALEGLSPDEAESIQRMTVIQSRRQTEQWKVDIFPAVEVADHAFLGRLEKAGGFSSFDVGRLPSPFPGPALFLMGRQDASVGYRDAWKILEDYPRATFAILDRAGHCLTMEQEGLFHALVNEWLDRLEEMKAKADHHSGGQEPRNSHRLTVKGDRSFD